jgi:UPF0176 protein
MQINQAEKTPFDFGLELKKIQIVTFYKFVSLPDRSDLQPVLETTCQAYQVKGTILLAEEGLNATLAGSAEGIEAVLSFLHQDERFADLACKYAWAGFMPFGRLRVRLKKEIVALKDPDADPNVCVGTYVEPDDWNRLIADPEVILIDTRNAFEAEVGTFEGAIDPRTESFSAFTDFVSTNLDPTVHRKVALFCTGGIRCEKATSHMLQHGFEEVYHLKGGILNYLEHIPKENSKWQGDCFVFDERVTVNHDLQPGDFVLCPNCQRAIPRASLHHDPMAEQGKCAHAY